MNVKIVILKVWGCS